MAKICKVLHLNTVEYGRAVRFQETLMVARQRNLIPDTLILLQHPPVFTIGRAGTVKNVLAPQWMLEQEGISVFESSRGGDITYHGPGQLVVYPILRLTDHGGDIRGYARMMEQTAITLLEQYGIKGERAPKYPGVWVGPAKVTALGIAVKRWVSMHGIAINVNPNLAHFAMINPCGLGKPVTSISALLGRPLDVKEAQQRYVGCFAQVFGVETTEVYLESVEEYEQEITALVEGESAER